MDAEKNATGRLVESCVAIGRVTVSGSGKSSGTFGKGCDRRMVASVPKALEVTRQQTVGQISQAVQPIIVSVYKDRRCDVLVDQASILAGNPAMNVTDAVIATLNAKVTSIALPAQADAKHM